MATPDPQTQVTWMGSHQRMKVTVVGHKSPNREAPARERKIREISNLSGQIAPIKWMGGALKVKVHDGA